MSLTISMSNILNENGIWSKFFFYQLGNIQLILDHFCFFLEYNIIIYNTRKKFKMSQMVKSSGHHLIMARFVTFLF